MKNRRFLRRVYVVNENGPMGDFIVRVETNVSDTCLCVCNGQIEADVVCAMVLASAWNTESQEAHSVARKLLTEFMTD